MCFATGVPLELYFVRRIRLKYSITEVAMKCKYFNERLNYKFPKLTSFEPLIQSHSVFKFSGHFREGRDSEIAPTEERFEHQVRTTRQLNGSASHK